MKIVTRLQFSGHWTAVDDATYDGPGCPIGAGPTEAAAIANLIDQIEGTGARANRRRAAKRRALRPQTRRAQRVGSERR